MAKFAGRRSAGVESRCARKRRCAISQTNARLARHQPDCAHAHVTYRGGAGVEEFFAIASALVRLRTARDADRASRNAMADLQHTRQDRHVRQDVARQGANSSGCAKRGTQLERAAPGWMAAWILACRHSATAGR